MVFFSCQLFESDDDDEIVAAVPVVKSISDDVSTVVNIAKAISITAETSDKGSLSYQWYEAKSKLEAGVAISSATERLLALSIIIVW